MWTDSKQTNFLREEKSHMLSMLISTLTDISLLLARNFATAERLKGMKLNEEQRGRKEKKWRGGLVRNII